MSLCKDPIYIYYTECDTADMRCLCITVTPPRTRLYELSPLAVRITIMMASADPQVSNSEINKMVTTLIQQKKKHILNIIF